jgi:hypothetical protein
MPGTDGKDGRKMEADDQRTQDKSVGTNFQTESNNPNMGLTGLWEGMSVSLCVQWSLSTKEVPVQYFIFEVLRLV